MSVFNLPDLGEGLPEAEIREWYVKPGDTVTLDQPLVAMETAKALVDVPSPKVGIIKTCFGAVGDTVQTGDPLVDFEQQDTDTPTAQTSTVDDNAVSGTIQAPAMVRALANKLGVDINALVPADGSNTLTIADVKNATGSANKPEDTDYVKLSPARQAMSQAMQKSHAAVVPVTLMDDADIDAWYPEKRVILQLIRSLVEACKTEPMLNAHFNGEQDTYKKFSEVNLGIAVDSPHGLYVPVIKDVGALSDDALLQKIKYFQQAAQGKTITAEEQKGATIMLSNFGALSGKYANPIVTPPMTAILGVGRCYTAMIDSETTHTFLPLSLSCDHRIVTGGEMARFLKALITHLN